MLKMVYTTLKIEFLVESSKWVFMNIIWMPVVFTAKFIFTIQLDGDGIYT